MEHLKNMGIGICAIFFVLLTIFPFVLLADDIIDGIGLYFLAIVFLLAAYALGYLIRNR